MTLEPNLHRLLANAVLGALQQYCVTTSEYMLHDTHPLSTAYHGSTSLDLGMLSYRADAVRRGACGETAHLAVRTNGPIVPRQYVLARAMCAGRIADSLTMASTPVILMGRAHQSLLVQTRGEPTVSGTVACCARDFGAKSSPVACECGFGGLAAVLRDN